MLYRAPDTWSEDSFNALPDEDDRYEYKSGRLIDDVIRKTTSQDELESKLRKEIGALANSFGGTLFIGAEDKTKTIDGCPLVFKGKETTKEWLEKKIPEWFEFRLYSFRVNYVNLTAATKKRLGKNRGLIHIDIWDSGFLPHQVKKDGRYYYREGSASVVAPHYYLAYLWSSRSSTMSEKVRKWCLEFLNPAYEFLDESHKCLRDNSFKITRKNIEYNQSVPDIILFGSMKWSDFLSDRCLAAKQFFYVFPKVRDNCIELLTSAQSLQRAFDGLCNSIGNTGVIESEATKIYRRINQQYPHIEVPSEKGSLLRHLAGAYHSPLGELHDQLAGEVIGGLIEKMIAWRLLNVNVMSDFEPKDRQFWNFCGDFAEKLRDDGTLKTEVGTVSDCLDTLCFKTKELRDHFDEQRDQLAATHATTYF